MTGRGVRFHSILLGIVMSLSEVFVSVVLEFGERHVKRYLF